MERNELYIISFLTFFVTFLCQDKKVNNLYVFVKVDLRFNFIYLIKFLIITPPNKAPFAEFTVLSNPNIAAGGNGLYIPACHPAGFPF